MSSHHHQIAVICSSGECAEMPLLPCGRSGGFNPTLAISRSLVCLLKPDRGTHRPRRLASRPIITRPKTILQQTRSSQVVSSFEMGKSSTVLGSWKSRQPNIKGTSWFFERADKLSLLVVLSIYNFIAGGFMLCISLTSKFSESNMSIWRKLSQPRAVFI